MRKVKGKYIIGYGPGKSEVRDIVWTVRVGKEAREYLKKRDAEQKKLLADEKKRKRRAA
ncbi:MAG: hypothetical protein IT462_08625 [Planctomycetes bacterium]|nr:hypothetical protein [Planctomycetota bacterium]